MQATLEQIWHAARQGEPTAIATLINRSLHPKGIHVLARRQGSCLQIMLEATKSLPPDRCLQYILKGLRKLDPDGILNVRLHGRLLGDEWPEWTETLELKTTLPSSAPPAVQSTATPVLKIPVDAAIVANGIEKTVTPAMIGTSPAIQLPATALPIVPEPATPVLKRTHPGLLLLGLGTSLILAWVWYVQNVLPEGLSDLPNWASFASNPSSNTPSPAPEAAPTATPDSSTPAPVTVPERQTIRLKAVGDMVPGTSYPVRRKPQDPNSLLAKIKPYLQGADILFGNYESTLTNHPYPFKNTSKGMVFAFRSPPEYAKIFQAVGFNVLNIANNHSYDFNEKGFRDTMRSIEQAGMKAVGDKDQIVYITANGITTAWIGFATYHGQNRVQDIKAGQALVKKANQNADVVVISFHAGAEGADAVRTRNKVEYFYGEDRGNIVQFSRAMVDAGADLILGHGPHVPRALELYNGRLIAYSLGNFLGYKSFSTVGNLGKSLILEAELDATGQFVGGKVIPVKLDDSGIPQLDNNFATVKLIRNLTQSDFPQTPLTIGRFGELSPPEPISPSPSSPSPGEKP
ncbi:CapA family protein [Thermosynechococcaceae cyanobacterium BACA0444]|uniref:CapA family protein n=1 Tax=Pseudocalidococcus azoricus BACA0444 TaxID=2918990 RepID=A0AAE4FP89_9CYAN|nr:CapA family protein [Pseudocalidococcus azoricus]MDS3859728.1 CapA family protein [Pseudocalidococcus azoricus BACA0444]